MGEERFLSLIQPFDPLDILKKISTLFLYRENLKYNLIYDEAIGAVLRKHRVDINNELPKVSKKKFRKILEAIQDFDDYLSLDFPTSPFVSKGFAYQEVHLFPGANGKRGYDISCLSKALISSNDICSECKKRCVELIRGLGFLSESIYKRIEKTINKDYKSFDEPMVYDGRIADDACVFDSAKFFSLFPLNQAFIQTKIYSNQLFGSEDIQDISAYPKYAFTPFIVLDDGQILILNPTLISVFILQCCFEIAEGYKEKGHLIEAIYKEKYGEFYCCLSNLFLTENLKEIKTADSSVKGVLLNKGSKTFLCLFVMAQDTYNLSEALLDSSGFVDDSVLQGISESYDYILICAASLGGNISALFSTDQPLFFLSDSDFDLLQYVDDSGRLLLDYFEAKAELKKRNVSFLPLINEFDILAFYLEREHSFYMDDDHPLENLNLYVFFDYGFELREKCEAKKARTLSLEFNSGRLCLDMKKGEDGIFHMAKPYPFGFFTAVECSFSSYQFVYSLLSEMKGERDFADCCNIIELISNWLFIIDNKFSLPTFNIRVKIDNQIKAGFFQLSRLTDSTLFITFLPYMHWPDINNNDNIQKEKDLMKGILDAVIPDECDSIIEAVFIYEVKPILFTSSYNSFFINGKEDFTHSYPVVPEGRKQLILNWLGEDVQAKKEQDSNKDRPLMKVARDEIFQKLVNSVNCFDYQQIFGMILNGLETTLFNFENQKRIERRICADRPDMLEEIARKTMELNSSSVNLRFLFEYISSVKTTGKQIPNSIDLENLMALTDLYIAIGEIDDYISYGLVQDRSKILPSKRLLLFTDEIEKFSNAKNKLLENDIRYDFEFVSSININNYSNNPEAIRAYQESFGFTLTELIRFCFAVLTEGQKQASIVKCLSEQQINNIAEQTQINDITLHSLLDELVFSQRTNFFDVGSAVEVFPWRMNRLWSCYRRPFCKIDNKYYFGNQELRYSVIYRINAFEQGTERTDKKNSQLSQVMGEILKDKGEEFTQEVKKRLEEFGLVCFADVKKLGKETIGDKGKPLGDIDILAFDDRKKRVYIIEAKNYKVALTANQIRCEMYDFYGRKNGKSFYEKHLRRTEWIIIHKSLLKNMDPLVTDKYAIVPLFVVSQQLITSMLVDNEIPVIPFSELSSKRLSELKKQVFPSNQ